MKINRTFKNIKRLQEIATVFGTHGFSQVIEDVGLGRFVPTKDVDPDSKSRPAPTRLRMAFDELGPTFVKLGQMLALRPDLIPADFATEFKKLQDHARPLPFAEIKRQIEDEFECEPELLFGVIDEKPLGQASIAQVHRATLADGHEVVIKVRRTGIEAVIECDVSLLFTIAKLLDDYVPAVGVYNPVGIVNEFARVIRSELDFMQEAQHIELFRKNFAGSETVVIPEVFWDLTGNRVLTMSYLDGIPLSRIEAVREAGHDTRAIAEAGARAFLKMVFIDTYFHGDIHGGNVLVLKDGRLGFLDFGIVGHLDSRLLRDVATLFLAVLARDFRGVARTALNMSSSTSEHHVSAEAFARDLEAVLEPLLGLALKDIQSAQVFEQLTTVARRHGLQIPQDLILLGRALGSLEGLARELDPDFNVFDKLGEYAGPVIAERYKPERLMGDLLSGLRELADLSRDLPGQVQSLLRNAEQGHFAVEVKLRDKALFAALRREGYRLTSAILLGGGAVAVAIAQTRESCGLSGALGTILILTGSLGFLLTLLRDFKKL